MTLSLTDSLSHSTFTFDIQRATLETCDLWNIWSERWGDMTWLKKDLPINIPTHLPTYIPTYLSTYLREHPHGAKLVETCDLFDIWSEWCGDLIRQKTTYLLPTYLPYLPTLRHWLQYWQLRTWINDNLCYLTINCDTGRHSQFLRCFILICLQPTSNVQFIDMIIWVVCLSCVLCWL